MKKILTLLPLIVTMGFAEVTWSDSGSSDQLDEDINLIYHDYVNVAYPKKVEAWVKYEEGLLKRPKKQGDFYRPAMIKIPAGSFTMGDKGRHSQEDERYVHDVKIDYDFYIGKYEITVVEFAMFVKATGYKSDAEKLGGCKTYKDGKQQLNPYAYWRFPYFKQSKYNPVGCISYHDAKAYADWLTKKTGTRYRLPSESEWEYAARAGQARERSERELGEYAWYRKNASFSSHLVGHKKANDWGVFDMQGNVFEWCEDWYAPSYENVPHDGKPNRAGLSERRVARGGSWLNDASILRVANRAALGEGNPYVINGFRLVRDVK